MVNILIKLIVIVNKDEIESNKLDTNQVYKPNSISFSMDFKNSQDGTDEDVKIKNPIEMETKSHSSEKKIKTKVYFYMQMEYCDGDTLESYLIKNLLKKINTPRNLIFSFFSQIVCAVKHIHGNNVIHRDLK